MKEETMITKRTWKDFRSTGLLLFVNMFLHIFGWAIVADIKNENVIRVYPARVKFRGFSVESEEKAFIKLSEFINKNSSELLKEAQA